VSRIETFELSEALTLGFGPDPVSTAEYLEKCKIKPQWLPEKNLMLAVLDDAILCYQKYRSASKRRERRLFCEAKEWIFKERDDRIFSFESVSACLGIDPGWIRKGLNQWTERKLMEGKTRPVERKRRHVNRVERKRQLRPAASGLLKAIHSTGRIL
jgi:hypothetical protein